MSNWIKCSEQLPIEPGEYLYAARDRPDACVNFYVAQFTEQGTWEVEVYDRIYEWGSEPVVVSHWQPLPEPPSYD